MESKNWNAIEEYVVHRLQTLEAKVEQLTDELNREGRKCETYGKALVEIAEHSRIYKVGDQCFIDVSLIGVTKKNLWLAKALGLEEELKDEGIEEG